MVPPLAQVSVDGYDYSWATNVMGPYLLTTALLPALFAGAKSSVDGKARVVNTSSIMHHLCPINFDALVDGPDRTKLGQTVLYCQSKNVGLIHSGYVWSSFMNVLTSIFRLQSSSPKSLRVGTVNMVSYQRRSIQVCKP